MSGSPLLWDLLVECRFDQDVATTTVTVTFDLDNYQDSDPLFLLGNAHLFQLPDQSQRISFEEYVTDKGGNKRWFQSVSEPIRRKSSSGGNEVILYPVTKTPNNLKSFEVVLTYRTPYNTHLGDWVFPIPWRFDFSPNRYLSNLFGGDVRDYPALRAIFLDLEADSGQWKWSLEEKEIQEWCNMDPNLPQKEVAVKGVRMDHNPGLNKQTSDSVIILQLLHKSKSANIHFELPLQARRSQEMVAANLQRMQEHAHQQAHDRQEQVITFICDLRGSSQARDNDTVLSQQTQLFRAYWMQVPLDSFRQIKLMGDLVAIVLTPDQYRQQGGRLLCKHLQEMERCGMNFRGGLHIGTAISTDRPTHTDYHRGEEFNGDAINHGSKVGDFKENEGGLLASEAFMRWLKGDHHSYTPWRENHIFGDWITHLYRIASEELIPWTGDTASQASRHFADRMLARAKEIQSHLIVGLDPDLAKFPHILRQQLDANPMELEDILFLFNRAVIDGTIPYTVAYKPQAAFYEQYGLAGLRALERTLHYLREQDLPIILDAKRNDIGHTAGAYGQAWLAAHQSVTGTDNPWRVDALTINGYLGQDGVAPFLEADPDAGLFVLAKTSNASSGEFQDLLLSGDKGTIYEEMARLAMIWGAKEIGESGYSRIGLVVGATYPEAAAQLRSINPQALFLMPGVGAQGAGLEGIAMGCGIDGFGAFAAASRSVLYAFLDTDPHTRDPKKWSDCVTKAAADEAKCTRDAIVQALEKHRINQVPSDP